MSRVFCEEYDVCPECQKGRLRYIREGSCSCHIYAPCSSCVDMILECDTCGYQPKNVCACAN